MFILNKQFVNKFTTAFILLFLISVVISFFWISGALEFIGVPLGHALFNDTRVITAGAESFYQGYDPLVENPAMPTKNVMNYPRIWHLLFSFWSKSRAYSHIWCALNGPVLDWFVGHYCKVFQTFGKVADIFLRHLASLYVGC